jgi:aminoglycoside phosphotransferase (APT) family kinase protein
MPASRGTDEGGDLLTHLTPVFTHGELQVDHVFVAGDEITGVIDWSEASQGDALFDLAILTLGH